MLDGIAAAAPLFPRLKLDSVVIRGTNDDELVDLIEFGRRYSAEVRFIEYMDVGGATHWSMDRVVTRDRDARVAGRALRPHRSGRRSVVGARRSLPPPGRDVFGIISSTTQPFCEDCDRSRLTADGMWYLCLYASRGVDLASGAAWWIIGARTGGTDSFRVDARARSWR